jgi:uncharacterized protein (DUF433 family)
MKPHAQIYTKAKSVAQLLEAHPHLTREGTQAALSFAAKSLGSDVVYPIDKAAL